MKTPSQKSTVALIAASFALGAGGTALFMTRVIRETGPASTAHAGESHPESASDQGGQKEGGDETAPADAPVRLTPEGMESAGIRVETASLTEVRGTLVAPATVEVGAGRTAKVTPPVAGKVVRIHARLGESVRRGQPLITLDSFEVAQAHASLRQALASERQSEAQVQTARAEVGRMDAAVEEARAEVELGRTRVRGAQIALDRQRELARAGAFSQAPLQAAQSEVSEAQSELLRAQTELQSHTVARQRAERLFKEGIVSRAELEQAQLEFRQDEARVERAQQRRDIASRGLEREQKVFQGDLLSKQAVQGAEAEVRAAQAEVAKARQGVNRAQQDARRARKEEQAAQTAIRGARDSVAAARMNLFALEGGGHSEGRGGEVTLSAPFDGVVAEVHATLGEAVERSTPLVVLENLRTVVVQADVPEKDIARVAVGQPVAVTVAAYPGERFTGVVESIATQVNEKTRALAVRCRVENGSGRLRPEMFARVEIAAGRPRRVLAVPRDAVVEVDGKPAVFVRRGEAFHSVPVATGTSMGVRIEIESGLQPGERVVTSGAFTLKSEAMKGELKEEE